MAGTALIWLIWLVWLAAGALGGLLATGLMRRGVYTTLGGAMLGMVAGLLGGGIVALFDGAASPDGALGSVGIAFVAGLLQILAVRFLNQGGRPARW